MDIERLDLDLHRLELRFAGARVAEPRAIERLARSIERCGQLVPCIVVATEADDGALVLIDGYRRVAALRRLGHDTAGVERWACGATEALLGVLARAEGRPFAVIEEALLLRDLVQAGQSQHEVARRCGRDPSWVSRRLQLLSALPDGALAAVREGVVSSWAATRVLVPLARANAAHADRLLEALRGTTLSTRELRCWLGHYEKASRKVRERMVEQPRLLLDALAETQAQSAAGRLRSGPEGDCASDLRVVEAVLSRLRERIPGLRPVPDFLRQHIHRLRAAIDALAHEIEREDDHDSGRDPRRDPGAEGTGPQPARDRPAAGAVP